MGKEPVMRIFPGELRRVMSALEMELEHLEEIRLRAEQPLLVVWKGGEYFVSPEGNLTRQRAQAYRISGKLIKETVECISSHSLYAYEEELKQGFLTIQGGHRIGVAGKMVMEDGKVRTIKHLSFLNIRLAHEIYGCADSILPYLYGDQHQILHTLLISPPRCGKTTLLRDLIRQFSNGREGYAGVCVGVVDERSEIGACYQGIPQNDLGIRTDVLDCCPKQIGMMMLIRTMSPDVVAVDEIGSRGDMEAMEYVMNCGCRLLASVHGASLDEIRRKPVLERMVREQWFERYVVLDRNGAVGHVAAVLDEQGRVLSCG